MEPIRVLIVEDNRLLAAGISELLAGHGFATAATLARGEDVAPWLRANTADVILMDVRLEGAKNGIDTVAEIARLAPAPVVFLTAQEDTATLERALATRPAAYLTKPYKDVDLISAVRLAAARPPEPNPAETDTSPENRGVVAGREGVFLRTRRRFERVAYSDIFYLHADRSYTEVVLADETITVSKPMGNLLEAFPAGRFVRIHRSYAVNLEKITAFDHETLSAGPHDLPFSPSYRDELMALLQEL